MARFAIRRLLQGVLVLWGATVVVFLVIHLIPGDPGRVVLGDRASQAAVERLDHQLGLDESLIAQYLHYLGRLLHGDLGESVSGKVTVGSLIGPRIVPSLVLMAYAIVISVVFAVPVGVLSALKANRVTDHVIRAGSVVLYAIPSFWFGLMLAVVFGLELHLLPTSGYEDGSVSGVLETLTLPAVTVALFTFPVLMRLIRSNVIDNLGAESVVAARARGLSRRRVMLRHVLRGSLGSSITFVGVSVGTLLSLSVVVEQVFAIPGLGSLLIASVINRDYPTVEGLTLVFATAVVLANIGADLANAALDPRVRA